MGHVPDLIPARKHPGVEWVCRQYGRWLLRRSFHALHMQIQEPVAAQGGPLLFYANHSSWWDGPLLVHLNGSVLKHDLYVWMDSAGLVRYPVFSRIGAFGVRRGSPAAARSGLRYAQDLLAGEQRPEQRRSLWIFPQGGEQPLERRPLSLEGGVRYLGLHLPVEIRPVAFYYRLGHYSRPEAFVKIGPPFSLVGAERRTADKLLRQRLEELLNALRLDVNTAPIEQVPGYHRWGW
ncbi:MAG: lysophospholipid acyltransferase family protein [Bacillota bacterium]